MFGQLLTPTHLIFVAAIVLIIFGPKRLPEIGRSLGSGLKEFKKSTSEIQQSIAMEESKPAADTANVQQAAEIKTEAAQPVNSEAKMK